VDKTRRMLAITIEAVEKPSKIIINDENAQIAPSRDANTF
jgi:hypothetical protein